MTLDFRALSAARAIIRPPPIEMQMPSLSVARRSQRPTLTCEPASGLSRDLAAREPASL